MKTLKRSIILIVYNILTFIHFLTRPALAYIDPGSLGFIYQMGYLIFYGIVGVVIFFFRPIKAFFYKIIGKEVPVEKPDEEEGTGEEGEDEEVEEE